ncbi:MAG: methyl-accepting chemotaxis protein [Gemmatimonadaceae bacterium]
MRWRLVTGVGSIALGVLAAIVWGTAMLVGESMHKEAVLRLTDVANRSDMLVEAFIRGRNQTIAMIAATPRIVDAATNGASRSRSLGLASRSVDELEQMLDEHRSLDVDADAREYLRSIAPLIGLSEAIVTDANGYNVVTTNRPSDFVQADELWWRQTMRGGNVRIESGFDASAGQVAMSLAVAIRRDSGEAPIGAVKAVFGVLEIDEFLRGVSVASEAQVDLVDGSGQVIASSTRLERLKPLPFMPSLTPTAPDSLVLFGAPGNERVAAIVSVSGHWYLIAHKSQSAAFAPVRSMRLRILGGAVLLLAVIVATLAAMQRLITKKVTEPAAALAVIAEGIATGDLEQSSIAQNESNDELGRLSRSTGWMLGELRRLVTAIRGAAQDNSSMASEITAASEQMSATASEVARTSGDLSTQSSSMAETIRQAAEDAAWLKQTATRLTEGARSGVANNSTLRTLAEENRTRLFSSVTTLAELGADAQAGAAAAETVAAASEDIRAFVTLVRKIARQSQLLALNAAMEAARAGEHGDGFAVVAAEIRKLATTSGDAAERTAKLVTEVLKRVEDSRQSSQRTAATVATVQTSTQDAIATFAQIEDAIAYGQKWLQTLEDAAGESNSRVGDLNKRLDALAQGTESFAAAMQQVAASAQEQSASTEEIAAAAATLAEAARLLTELVSAFRLGADAQRSAPLSAA